VSTAGVRFTFEHLEGVLAARGVDLSAVRPRADGTIAQTDVTVLAGVHAVDDESPGDERLELGALLGRGGMGEVRAATQRSLRREVAVKTVLEPTSESARSALLKEAWVGASLEHPSVVPIHTLARTPSGVAVVMKRIEGVTWSRVMQTPEAHPRFAGEGALEAHLRVLVQVCHAISFAHGRGVLHLDLKPDNVMIGELGEVYVVDWGLACATDDGPSWLARASAITGPLGTPSYMAPELASGDGRAIDPRTDVYLLGALLHYVVTGGAPHERETFVATLAHAYLAEPPEYGPEVPRELAAIATRALTRAPEERFESADALRIAIEAFLRHRGAEHLAARAEEVLSAIEARLGKGDPDAEVETLFAECEVAITEVRREWEGHPRLDALETASAVLRVRHAIADGRADDADAWLARLASPAPELVRDAAALRKRIQARDRHVSALEGLERELDLTLGSTERRRVFAILGASWTILSIAFGVLERAGLLALTYRDLLMEGALLVGTLTPWAFLERRALFQNRANRRLHGGLIFTALAVELWWLTCMQLDVPVHDSVAVTPLFYAYAMATLGLAIDRRFFQGALVMLVTTGCCAVATPYVYDLTGVGGGLAVALTLTGKRAVTGTPTVRRTTGRPPAPTPR
jgi:hypothetical protein